MTPSVQEIIPTRPAFNVHDVNPADGLQRRKCNKRMNPIRLDHNRVYDKIGAIKVNPSTFLSGKTGKRSFFQGADVVDAEGLQTPTNKTGTRYKVQGLRCE